MNRPRNILFITTDQQRRDTLPCYGREFMKTPALDRLAREGMVFDACTSVSPVCQPARASFILGQYPHVHGVSDNFNWISPNSPTIARLFNKAGWNTAAIGKMHFYPWNNPEGFRYRVIAEDKRHIFLQDDYTKFLEDRGLARDHPATVKEYADNLGAFVSPLPEEYHIDTYIGDEAVKWLKTVPAEPFFAWISFNSPHDPYDPPKSLAALYKDAPVPEPVGGREELVTKPAYQRKIIDYYSANPLYLTDYSRMPRAKVRKMREMYLATVTHVDRQVEKILGVMEETGLLDSTLIVFSSDHGDNLGDHGLPFKYTFYEGSLMVPLIIRGPGVMPGSRCSSFVDLLDLHATFLALAGIERPEHAQGTDITCLLQDPETALKSEAFSELTGCAMVRTADYKLVLYDSGEGELYNLREEPLEVVNHYYNPGYREIREELTERLTRHLLANSRVRSFGGGPYPSPPERETKILEIRRKAANNEYPGAVFPKRPN